MKSHPRSMQNGKHRRTSPPAHGSPVDGASAGKSGRTSLPRAKWRTLHAGVPISHSLMPISDPGVIADQLKPRPGMVTYVSRAFMTNHLLDGMIEPKPSIPHAGITAGEIEGR